MTKSNPLQFSAAPDHTYRYERDLVQAFDEGNAQVLAQITAQSSGHATDPTPHHWRGSLIENPELPWGRNPACVICEEGMDAPCSDCRGGPPCGGTVYPITQIKKRIRIHPSADFTNPGEISFSHHPTYKIAVLAGDKPVRDLLKAWRAASPDKPTSRTVYHVYRIDQAASREELEGKLIAIPVAPEADVAESPAT